MKNVKKLLKKAMVFTLAASMLVGTPLTASAAGIRGVYSVSDGTNQSSDDKSHTGTVTNTDTNTNSGVLKDNYAAIIGIALDKDYVKAEKGVKETLKATIVLDGDLVGKGKDATAEQKKILKEIESKIKWEVFYSDGKSTVMDNVAANKVLSIEAKATDRTVVTLNPRQGTVAGEEMIVRATIDGRYRYYKDENDEIVREELKEGYNRTESYTAEAKVSIKEYTEKLVFDGDIGTEVVEPMPTAYVKQSLDLNDYIVRKPETANDEITWISTNTKVATVTAAGVVTFKKVNAKENADGELELTAAKDACQIIAVGERGGEAKDTWDVYVEAGTPASKIVIMDRDTNKIFTDGKKADNKKAAVDIRDDGDWEKEAYVVKYAKVKAAVDDNGEIIPANGTPVTDSKGKVKSKTLDLESGTSYIEVAKDNVTTTPKADWAVTDTITWTSNKPAIVSVDADDDEAVLYAKGVGTAAITAKASSGKSDKVTVTVKATLKDLWIADQNGDVQVDDALYSGKSLQLYVGRDPEENKDAVKWSIEQEEVEKKDKNGNVTGTKKVKNPNATINAKGVLTIKPKLDLSDDEYRTVTVVLEPKKTVLDPDGNEIKDTVTFTVEQSSIDGITVTDDAGTPIAAVATTYNNNNVGKVAQVKLGAANTTYISVPKNRTYTAEVTPSKDVNGEGAYQAGSDTLTWTTSNAKVASIEYDGGTAKITANASGTATITVSGVRAVNQTKNGTTSLKSASVIKTTFKVSVKQPVKTVTLNKSSVVLNEKLKKNVPQDQKVALKATLGPKGVGKKELIHWSVKENGELLTDTVALGLEKKGKEVTSASVSVNLPTPEIGDVFEITATAESGASATSVVTIVEKTTGVEIRNAATNEIFTKPNPKPGKDPIKDTVAIEIGDSITMAPYINISATKNAPVWKEAGTANCEDIVSYTVNKKGIVNIDEKTGKVYAVKDGKVTITAKTALGKSAKLTVEVSK
ncbi:MAG: hypothetical protein HDR06_03540 [Lachnospiraceae bacterium]|nr:hypothetical protein [Lachnospiraceae bacterium]